MTGLEKLYQPCFAASNVMYAKQSDVGTDRGGVVYALCSKVHVETTQVQCISRKQGTFIEHTFLFSS